MFFIARYLYLVPIQILQSGLSANYRRNSIFTAEMFRPIKQAEKQLLKHKQSPNKAIAQWHRGIRRGERERRERLTDRFIERENEGEEEREKVRMGLRETNTIV